jgi:hypothetical protein
VDVDLFVLHLYATLGPKDRSLISNRIREALQAVTRRFAKQVANSSILIPENTERHSAMA